MPKGAVRAEAPASAFLQKADFRKAGLLVSGGEIAEVN
jgi:hypothetical protein